MQDLSDLGSQANMELVDLLAKKIGLLVIDLEVKTKIIEDQQTHIKELEFALTRIAEGLGGANADDR